MVQKRPPHTSGSTAAVLGWRLSWLSRMDRAYAERRVWEAEQAMGAWGS